ncbi:MAG: Lar family restriction alleviation protein [Eggerthellaceae bacterium]|nr:Lar family restriction alleviation protein [Eggerthellaceae bacterium]
MTDLKPCPFCGGKAEIHQNDDSGMWHVNTMHCGNDSPFHHAYVIADTEAEAIAAWNTRAELGSRTCELEETEVYTAHETVHVLECSACGETCEHVNGGYPRCPHCGRKAVKR